ncbi:MAG: HAD family phosphatase [Clostridia bacterium]|nr:HAD family phosphatase [Clostridia bacterium]
MIKAYLFDFDGTLVDSMPNYVYSMLRILDENGIKYDDDIVKIITPLGLYATADYYIELGVKKTREEIIMQMKEYMYEEYLYNIPAKENVIGVLKNLKENGAKLSVLTASPHVTLDPCLKRLGIFDLFDNVWSCDDFSTTKADPQIYVKAAEKIGEKVEDILFLDDNYNADVTAKKAGMQVCGVYDESSKDYVDEIKTATDYYIYNFAELLV